MEKKRNIKVFDGDKYSAWKIRVRALLNELDVIKVIDNETPGEISENWLKAERTAKCVIIEYLSDSFLNFVKPEYTAKQIFKNLDKIYERKSLATQLALRKKLLTIKLQGDTPLSTHFLIFDELVAELLAAGAKLDEADKISHLFITLPGSYDGIITAIETLAEENLNLGFVKTRLLDHEVKIAAERRDTSAKVLLSENRTTSTKRRPNFLSPKMKKNVHQEKFKYTKKSNTMKCYHCGRKGHAKIDCFYYKRGKENKNTENKKTAHTAQSTESGTSNTASGFAFMAGENSLDRQQSLNFFLDSGASEHLINKENLTKDFIILQPPTKIYIAKNGAYITATKKGNLEVVSNLGVEGLLEDVLYCADLPYNLLSVRKMQQAGLTIIFDEEGVKIKKGGKVIITGEQLADVLTKPLPSVKFMELRKGMGLF